MEQKNLCDSVHVSHAARTSTMNDTSSTRPVKLFIGRRSVGWLFVTITSILKTANELGIL